MPPHYSPFKIYAKQSYNWLIITVPSIIAAKLIKN